MALQAAAAAMSMRRASLFQKNGHISLLGFAHDWIGTPLHIRRCSSLAAVPPDRRMDVAACSAIKTSARGQVRGQPHGGGVDWMESTENIQLINTGMGMEHFLSNEVIVLTGKSLTWGIESEWTLKWGLDGCFHEQFKNAEFIHEWGHDGKVTWHADAAGRVSRLELDEGEVCLLSAWVRTGFWVTDEAQKHLDIQQERSGTSAVLHSPDKELLFSIKLKNKQECCS